MKQILVVLLLCGAALGQTIKKPALPNPCVSALATVAGHSTENPIAYLVGEMSDAQLSAAQMLSNDCLTRGKPTSKQVSPVAEVLYHAMLQQTIRVKRAQEQNAALLDKMVADYNKLVADYNQLQRSSDELLRASIMASRSTTIVQPAYTPPPPRQPLYCTSMRAGDITTLNCY